MNTCSFYTSRFAAVIGLTAIFCAHAQTPDYFRPGLIQAKFSNATTFANVCDGNVLTAPNAERVLGPVMADVNANEASAATAIYVNPLSGNGWTWDVTKSGFGYVGEMYVKAGVTYTFGKYLDDSARIIVGGRTILNNSVYNNWVTGTFTTNITGWVSFDVRIHDGNGGKGPSGSTWGSDLGLAYNTANLTAMAPKTSWTKLLDPGDGSRFRTPFFAATPTEPVFAPFNIAHDGANFNVSGMLTHGAADIYALAGFQDNFTITNLIHAGATANVAFAGAFTTLAADTAYSVALFATNSVGETDLSDARVAFYNGMLELDLTQNAKEEAYVPGIVTVRRAATDDATRLPLTVNYTITGGTAVEGVNYKPLSGNVTIPAGASSAQIIIEPLLDRTSTGDTTLDVSLVAGPYAIASATPITVTISKWVPSAEYNTWVAPADGLASDAANWTQGVPQAGHKIKLSTFSSANMTWDAGVNGLTDTVASWSQDEFYTGTVTFMTTYPEYDATFSNFTVTGDVDIRNGVWTHPANNTTAAYRLRVTAGGGFTLDTAAKIDLQYKGYASGRFPAGGAVGVHGGSRTDFSKVYGDVYEPVALGAGGGNRAGGGALFLSVGGVVTINGNINANSDQPSNIWAGQIGGAGGSIYIRANSINGNGTIAANGTPSQSYASSGGRIALITTAAAELGFPLEKVYARGNVSLPAQTAGAGTVFIKNASQPNGTLLIDNAYDALWNNYFFFPSPRGTTCVPPGQTWTFDAIITRNYGVLSVPEGATLVLPNGFGSVTSADATRGNGILYLGGNIDVGGDAPYTFKNNWVFQAGVPYTINADVYVTHNGALGCLPLNNSLDSFTACHLTINGNLTVDATSRITAANCGVDFDANNLARISSHGGQAGALAGRYAYGSILNPVHPGMFGSDHAMYLRRDTRGPGGGVIVLNVNGAFQLDGVVDTCARDLGYNNNGGAGGSINITAATLAGTGSIDASGYHTVNNHPNKYCPGAGRVAVRLTTPGATFDNFGESRIMARGSSGANSNTTRTELMSSAGTVYLETAEDGPGADKIIIWNDNVARNIQAFTPLPSHDYGGIDDDLSTTRLDIGNCARVKLFDSVRVAEASIRTGTQLDLNGHTLRLSHLSTDGTPLGQYGTFTAAQLAAMGRTGIIDTSEDRSGLLKIVSNSTLFFLK